jgi:hypothetical protein
MMTKPGQHEGAADDMHELQDGKLLGDDREEVGQFGATPANGVAHRILHPGIGDQDPDRREIGPDRHQPGHGGVGFGGELLPPEMPDADKGGFQEKGRRGFDRQKRTEDIPDIGRIARPVGAELEFERDAGHDPHGKIDQKDFAPELGHGQIGFVAGAHIAGLHIRDDPTQAQGQGHEKKMKGRG